MQLFEMQGLLAGKCLPGDIKVNESLAEYLLRKLEDRNELERQLSAKTISEQNIINAFGIKGEGAHSKLVIEYVSGLVAERDALAKSVDKMADIGDLINSQNNRCTDQPFFAVLTKKEVPASEEHGFDRVAWVHPDRDYAEADDRTAGRLELLHEDGRDTKGWERIPVVKVDEFRVGCFTEQGCKDYISRNGHNLNEPFIYAYGSYRNNEFQEVRNFLIEAANLRAGRKG